MSFEIYLNIVAYLLFAVCIYFGYKVYKLTKFVANVWLYFIAASIFGFLWRLAALIGLEEVIVNLFLLMFVTLILVFAVYSYMHFIKPHGHFRK